MIMSAADEPMALRAGDQTNDREFIVRIFVKEQVLHAIVDGLTSGPTSRRLYDVAISDELGEHRL